MLTTLSVNYLLAFHSVDCGLWIAPHTSKDISHLSLQLSSFCLFAAHASGKCTVLKDKPPFPSHPRNFIFH